MLSCQEKNQNQNVKRNSPEFLRTERKEKISWTGKKISSTSRPGSRSNYQLDSTSMFKNLKSI